MANESVPAGERPRIGSTPRVSSDFFPREAGFSPAGRAPAAYDTRTEDRGNRPGHPGDRHPRVLGRRRASARCSPGAPERTVRLVPDRQGEHGSQWPAIVPAASMLGGMREKLRKWRQRAVSPAGRRRGAREGTGEARGARRSRTRPRRPTSRAARAPARPASSPASAPPPAKDEPRHDPTHGAGDERAEERAFQDRKRRKDAPPEKEHHHEDEDPGPPAPRQPGPRRSIGNLRGRSTPWPCAGWMPRGALGPAPPEAASPGRTALRLSGGRETPAAKPSPAVRSGRL